MLYRKYRSQTFSELIGQDDIVRILRQSLVEGRVAHAYLFTGPRGTGKTSTARIMAKALNCLNLIDGEPCNQCSNCIGIVEGRFLDLVEIDAASNRGIEEIRSLKEKMGFLPVEGKNKVYIVDEVHMLTGEAFNALLKTLEEPPANVIFILATTEVHKLPATILSRTQRFDFKLAGDEDIIAKLSKILKSEGIEADQDAMAVIARGGMGSFRDSETVLEKIISSRVDGKILTKKHVEDVLGYADSEIVTGFLNFLIGKKTEKALQAFNEVIAKGINMQQFVKQILEATRLKVLDSVRSNDKNAIRVFMQIIKEFNQAAGDLKFALVPQLTVEMTILNLTQGGGTDTNVVNPPVQSRANPIQQTKLSEPPIKKVVDEKPSSVPLVKLQDVSENVVGSDEPLTDQEVIKVDINQLYLKWLDVINESRVHNHHLVAVLSGAVLRQNEQGGLLIVVPYQYHKDRLCGAETRKIVQSVFKKVYGNEIPYQCEIDKSILKKDNKISFAGNQDLVENLLQ